MNLVKSLVWVLGIILLGMAQKKILYHNDKGFLKIK